MVGSSTAVSKTDSQRWNRFHYVGLHHDTRVITTDYHIIAGTRRPWRISIRSILNGSIFKIF